MNYILSLIIFIITIFFSIGIFDEINKKNALNFSRINCHKKTTIFEKVINPSLIQKLNNSLSKNTKLYITFETSKYMKSTLLNYISKKSIKEFFVEELEEKNSLKNIKEKTSLEILIYENDKEDPNKKTKQCKLYRGYLLVNFKLRDKEIYKIQIDFYDEEAKDLKETISCIFKSLDSIKK